MKNQRFIYAIIIFLLVFLVAAGLSRLFHINNGILPGVMLGAGMAIWYHQYYKKEEKEE